MAGKTNALDRMVALVSPMWALKRMHARSVLAYYEAAKPSRLRKGRRETGSGNAAVLRAGPAMWQIARHLEQNYDLARGVLAALVTNTVGAKGIGVEFQPRNKDGTINTALAAELSKAWKDWCRHPEVTMQHDYASMCRLLARSWFRDGEVFSQTISGFMPTLNHGTKVPFSVEMLEADYVPMDMQSSAPVVTQGIELNAWGAPVAYHVHKTSPLDGVSISYSGQTKRVPAQNMLHVKHVDRIRQLRGVSIFASVLNRFDDLKDYEESERIAAKIAASMAAFIKKGDPTTYTPDIDGGKEQPRSLSMQPGMIFDDLRPGEEIGTINTNRPNPNLEPYRDAQMRAIAAGTGPTFSSVARSYNGTYSAQRQELVEGFGIYSVLAEEFISRIVQPIVERFVATAVASGAVTVPSEVVPDSVDDAIYIAPAMPWIDPKKEAEAWAMLEDRCYISGPEIVRKRGGNPADVVEQQAKWLERKKEAGVPAAGVAPAPAPNPDQTANADEMSVAALRTAKARADLAEAEQRRLDQIEAREAAEHDARLAVLQAQARKDHAAADAAQAARDAADADRALTEARADRERVETEMAAERAKATSDLFAEEHAARMAELAERVETMRRAEREREEDAQRARARADELHQVALQAEQDRRQIAAVDLAAAQEALAELREAE